MRPKSLLLLALALGCGLIASLGISEVINSRSADATEPTVPVLVASVDIDRSTLLSAENVVVKQWPAATIPEGALSDLAEIEGMRAHMQIAKDIPLTQAMLGGSMRAAEAVPEGYRPFNVRLNQEGGSIGLIKPGDRVDVLVFAQKNPAYGIYKTGVWTLLSDVEVFAKDSKIVEDDGDEESSSQSQSISLLVTPEQVEKLALADELGKIRLTLRGLNENSITADDRADLPAIFGGKAVEPVAPVDQEMPDLEELARKIREEERKRYENMLAALPPQEPKRQVDWSMELWNGPRPSVMEFAKGELPAPRVQQVQPGPVTVEDAVTEPEPELEPETPVDEFIEGFEEDETEGATTDTQVKKLVEEKIKEFFGPH